MRFDNKLLYLFGFSLILRILINIQDPFLHSWDERFHALVAKNMMTHPFTPMLRTDPVLPYDETSWTEGHFWVHKQPLFLWQMALSMKLFGVNLFALRLPSALMGALSVLLISRIGILFNNKFAGLVAALLFTFSSYQLELTNGVVGMDHNDVAFGFYILASFWCYFEYRESNKKYWVLLIGLFAGCAILNKWLVGLLIFAIWGIEILLQYKMHMRLKHFIPMLQALVICCIVFIPWQIYILNRFPKQAAFTYQFNERHITEALEGHTGSVFYFLQIFPWQYSFLIIPFLIIALIGWLKNKFSTKMFLPLAFAIFIIYFFFSVIVKTKSSNYVFIVAPFIFLISGFGFDLFRHWVINLFDKKKGCDNYIPFTNNFNHIIISALYII
ncbi:MAG: glycosyltransferase family 39 protein [Bacteroidetes bacterium]|nr:glycosyltransferase family 39 protein [Bacteroidota bacterium]